MNRYSGLISGIGRNAGELRLVTPSASVLAQNDYSGHNAKNDIVDKVIATLELSTGITWTRTGHRLVGDSNERVLVLYSKYYGDGKYLYGLHSNQFDHLAGQLHAFIAFCFAGIDEFVPITFESVASNLQQFRSRVHPKSGKACWRIELRSRPKFGNVPVADWFKGSYHYPFGYASVLDELGDYLRLRSGRQLLTTIR